MDAFSFGFGEKQFSQAHFMKICMLVKNPITNDPRVMGEARALRSAGHSVFVIGAWAEGFVSVEVQNGVRMIRVGAPRNVESDKKNWLPNKSRKLQVTRTKQGSLVERLRSSASTFSVQIASPVLRYKTRWLWVKTASALACDVYHAHDLNTLDEAATAARRNGARLIYDSHELWIEWRRNKVGASYLQLRRWSRVERRWISRAGMVVTVSDGISNELRRMYKLRKAPLVVYNCAELRPFVKSSWLRRNIGGSASRPIVLYQGGIMAGRGLGVFLELAKHIPQADFVMIGPASSDDYEKSLRNKVESLDNCYLLEPVPYPQLYEVTLSADAGFVCTEPACESYRLGLSNKIFEYMAAGLPIIASDIAGHHELLSKLPKEANPLITVPLDEPLEAARRVVDLLSDEARRQALGEAAVSGAETQFNRASQMAKLVEAYASIENSTSPRNRK